MTTFRERPPTVTLMSGEDDPLDVIHEVWCRSRDKSPGLIETTARRKLAEETFDQIIFDYTQIPEFIKYAWWVEGVPRSFFDQAVRHRKTSMFARSQRVRDCRNFASNGDYLTTHEIAKDDRRREVYETAMWTIETAYAELVKLGTPVEDARGLLPLHLRTGFGWGTTLRDLVDLFDKRTCHLLQQEYWAPVAEQMKTQLVEEVDPKLEVIFQPPCIKKGVCISPVEATDRTIAVLGGRYDLHPCRIWNARFEKPDSASEVDEYVKDGTTRWAVSPQEVVSGNYK